MQNTKVTSDENPFKNHEDIFYRDYGGAISLRKLALHLYNSAWPVDLVKICSYLDEKHYKIAIDMIHYYRAHGENCTVFMEICSKLQKAFWNTRPSANED